MKKTILTLGILGCMFAGCQNKHQEAATMDSKQENQVVSTIMARRSIRKYKQQPVEPALFPEWPAFWSGG